MEWKEDDVLDSSKINFSGDFDQQLWEVLNYVHLKRGEVESLNSLITDLYNVLSRVWKSIEVRAFGSIVTGLGMRTSDVDCYVQLPPWLHPPEKTFVIKARNILSRHTHLFEHAFAIVHAKVPIVQFRHIPTGVHCDLSFTSAAGVENSELLAYLLNSNKKALHLAIIVKYWSKIHNLTGTNLMSSYSMTLLVIFFLQQINMLPSVADLQENISERCVDDWNVAFGTPECSNRNNSISMYEILGQFFKFYNSFEFDKYIVSPYLGKSINRELFAQLHTVPLKFSQYKTNVGIKNLKPLRLDSVMCIQDLFEHNRNCVVAVYPKLAQRISAQIQKAVSIYENDSHSMFLKKLLESSTPASAPVVKKKKNRPPLSGVRKTYGRNQNTRQNYRGRCQGNKRNIRSR